ncbi:RNA polymerase [Kitasatospora albolonga]|uniref:RNA polymerase n=1 Tax=Kitasatospora albolonga TaxID=68173 RepID=A0ABC8BSS8_9ACTN|nr:RNA polymerase [Kitasatospora albolonga]
MEHNEQPARPAQPPDGGPDDDVRVRERIRAGDREAFGTLYDRYAKSVYGHACRLTGDLSAAEDVMSETFLAAWRTREQIDPEGGPLRPWLLGIATNKARNHRRGVGRRLAFLARQPRPKETEDFADASAERLDHQRELAAVRAVLDRLRQPEREVLALCVWAGLDYAQAAAALDVPVGTVRSRLSRARTRLRGLAGEHLARERGEMTQERREAGQDRRGAGRERREPLLGRGEVGGRAAFVALPGEGGSR